MPNPSSISPLRRRLRRWRWWRCNSAKTLRPLGNHNGAVHGVGAFEGPRQLLFFHGGAGGTQSFHQCKKVVPGVWISQMPDRGAHRGQSRGAAWGLHRRG